jgi:hypothetical protein
MNAKEVAKLLEVKEATVTQYMRQGRIPYEYDARTGERFVTRAAAMKFRGNRKSVGRPKKLGIQPHEARILARALVCDYVDVLAMFADQRWPTNPADVETMTRAVDVVLHRYSDKPKKFSGRKPRKT